MSGTGSNCGGGSSSCGYSSMGSNSAGSSGYIPMDFGSYDSVFFSPNKVSDISVSGYGTDLGDKVNLYMSRQPEHVVSQYSQQLVVDDSPCKINNNVCSDFFDPGNFLSSYRFPTMFVGKASEVQEMVEECFQKTLGEKIPDNIIIRICEEYEMMKIHEKFGGKWNKGIVGFALNRNKQNHPNEIFVKQDDLDKVMITIGHEIGHVLGGKLSPRKEEAKAFAFELAWLQTIRDHNVGGIGKNIIQINPAKNNFHDVAFEFVVTLIRSGQTALQVFKDLTMSSQF